MGAPHGAFMSCEVRACLIFTLGAISISSRRLFVFQCVGRTSTRNTPIRA